MKIKVIRGTGDEQAADKLSPLTSALNAALGLGRVELDLAAGFQPCSQTTPHAPDAELCSLAESFDRFGAAGWRGVVTGITHGMDSDGNVLTVQTFLRELSGD